MDSSHNRVILTLPLTAFTVIASCVGLFTPDFYSTETLNWQAQSVSQDFIDLVLIAPCLLITSILAGRNNKIAILIWGGVTLYLTYTFVIYCFDIHFNKLFILYCFCLGLSFYSLIYFLITEYKEKSKRLVENKTMIKIIGIYLLVIAVIFYVLWLSEIVPAIIHNTIPKSLVEVGLFTNGVHVIDLSIFLPGIFIAGILLLKRKSSGFLLTPVFLTFFVLMDITIGVLPIAMKMKGVQSDLRFTAIMSVFTAVTLVLLIWYMKSIKIVKEDKIQGVFSI